MKCTNKIKMIRLLCILAIAAVFMTGCAKTSNFESNYNPHTSALNSYPMEPGAGNYFAKDLCVTADVELGVDDTDSYIAEGAGVFNRTTGEVTYAKNLFERLYPASTTKILTAYLVIKYGNLDDVVTVSANAVNQASDSSVCKLKEGDVLSVRDLLYGLMLASGNDAAVALAEYVSGSTEEFAKLMNREAASLGATNSHFVNPNGLPDENHYTTVYDMYLIFNEALRYEEFHEIISTTSYTANYQTATGEATSNKWDNTNRYLSGVKTAPDGITVIGGKTGTTNAAGYCLVLCSNNTEGEEIISIVFKADGSSNLYMLMNEMLSGYAL